MYSLPAELPGKPFDLFRQRLASFSFISDLSVLNALQWKDFNSIGCKEQERREVERKSCVCVCVYVCWGAHGESGWGLGMQVKEAGTFQRGCRRRGT